MLHTAGLLSGAAALNAGNPYYHGSGALIPLAGAEDDLLIGSAGRAVLLGAIAGGRDSASERRPLTAADIITQALREEGATLFAVPQDEAAMHADSDLADATAAVFAQDGGAGLDPWDF